MNLSKYVTIKTSSKPAMSVGRVIGAITYEIYQRDMAIKNFVPLKYYKIVSDTSVKLTSKKKFKLESLEKAKEYAKALQQNDTIVRNIETKPTKKRAPK